MQHWLSGVDFLWLKFAQLEDGNLKQCFFTSGTVLLHRGVPPLPWNFDGSLHFAASSGDSMHSISAFLSPLVMIPK